MTVTVARPIHQPASAAERLGRWLILAALTLAALLLLHHNLARLVPADQWMRLWRQPDPAATAEMIALYGFLPRAAMAILAGAGLAFSGTILQHVLRNPLAEPTTLGVAAGAQLALTVATLFAPWAMLFGREWVALVGAGVAFATVLGLSASRALSPVTVTLVGLIISLYCGMAGAVLSLFHHDLLIGLFLWGAGYLDQNGWAATWFITVRIIPLVAVGLLLMRPMTLLGLTDEAARGLGLSVVWFRLAAMAVAVAITAVIVSSVGVISFVGLAAPAIVRLAGIRRLSAQLAWSLAAGALLLLLTDQLILLLPTTYRAFPTGAMTALLGAPVLIALLPRLKAAEPPAIANGERVRRVSRPGLALAILGILVVITFALSLSIAGGVEGPLFGYWDEIRDFRLPRTLAAFAGGMALAIAGTILQRQTGNPLAAPEVLGVSSGGILGTVAVMFLVSGAGRGTQMLGGGAGCATVMLFLLLMTRRNALSGQRLLLAGIALSSITGLVVAVLRTFQDPRLGQLLAWLSGSTYQTDLKEALSTLGVALLGLAALPFLRRWLTILPLGGTVVRSLGLSGRIVSLSLLGLVALLSAAATISIGPLSFVGVMGPHFARRAGLAGPQYEMPGAALFGGLVLMIADLIGRVVIFPYNIPAGLLTTVIGAPVLLLLMSRKSR